MEYAKDEIFSIRYKKKKDKLGDSKIHHFWKILRRNKFMTLLLSLGGLFSIINFILIYYFFAILKTI